MLLYSIHINEIITLIGGIVTILVSFFLYKNVRNEITKKKLEKEILENEKYDELLKSLRHILEETKEQCVLEIELLKKEYRDEIQILKNESASKKMENDKLKLEIEHLKILLGKINIAIEIAINSIDNKDDKNIIASIKKLFNNERVF
jgi:phenylalanyl-tRNA synthetase alpha subunit